jgi:hypothetical protein
MSVYIAIAPHPWMSRDHGTTPDGLAAAQLVLDGPQPLPRRLGAIPRLEPLFPKLQG